MKQFRPYQWGHNTLCSKTMLSPKRNSRQLWKKPPFLPRPHKSKYFRNRTVFTRILVYGVLNHSGERFQKGAHSVADSLVLWVHSTPIFPHWTQVKYRQITGKIHSRFLHHTKHISLTVDFFEIRMSTTTVCKLAKSLTIKQKITEVFDLGKKSPPLLLSPNTWPLWNLLFKSIDR